MASQPTRLDRLRQELATLAFITRGGNWLFLFMSRLAEPLMFFATLYVIAETVLPGMFKAATFVQISSAAIIVLNTAPEVILPGCFMQASMAEEKQRWMYKSMGVVFILLTFVTLASFIWDFPAGAVSVILFFRCAAGVLYSLLVRMTPQSLASDGQVDELQETFNQRVQQIESDFQRRLTEAVSLLQTDFQSSTETLSILPELKAQFAQIESLQGEIESLKRHLHKQTLPPVSESQKRVERPVLRAVPSLDEKFDIRSFVFACLQENASATIEAIQQQALSIGQTVSIGSISRYRKQYSENSSVAFNPSDIESA